MSEDHELLRSYASSRCELAFAQLVSRHVDFVYATALRVVGGDSHFAQDVAQSVFIDLNRKAPSLLHLRSLEAWLYQATRFAAAKAVRTEHRRSMREQAAIAMEVNSSQPTSVDSARDWERIAPVLDEAIEQLPTDDREAILLRFFARKNFRAVAEGVGTTEEAARKRVSRALEKLRAYLLRSGVSISETSLIAALATGTAAGAPPTFAATVTSAALAAPFALSGIATVLQIMTTAKTKIAIASLSLLTIPLIVQHQEASKLKEDNQKLTQQLHAVQAALEPETARTNAPSLSSTEHLELMRLRAEVTALRGELMRLRAQVTEKRHQEQPLAGANRGTPDQATLPDPKAWNEAQRLQMEKAATAIASFIENNSTERFFNNGQVNPHLTESAPGVDWTDIEIVLEDVPALKRIADFDPSSVVARSRKAIQMENGGWVRWYYFANGDVKPRLHASEQEVVVPFAFSTNLNP